MPLVDPSTGERLGAVVACSADDVEQAVGHALAAFKGWNQTPPVERRDALKRRHAALGHAPPRPRACWPKRSAAPSGWVA